MSIYQKVVSIKIKSEQLTTTFEVLVVEVLETIKFIDND